MKRIDVKILEFQFELQGFERLFEGKPKNLAYRQNTARIKAQISECQKMKAEGWLGVNETCDVFGKAIEKCDS